MLDDSIYVPLTVLLSFQLQHSNEMASRKLVGAGWGCSIYVTLTVLLSFQLQHTVMKWRVAIAAVGLVFAKKALDI